MEGEDTRGGRRQDCYLLLVACLESADWLETDGESFFIAVRGDRGERLGWGEG